MMYPESISKPLLADFYTCDVSGTPRHPSSGRRVNVGRIHDFDTGLPSPMRFLQLVEAALAEEAAISGTRTPPSGGATLPEAVGRKPPVPAGGTDTGLGHMGRAAR